MARIKIKDLPKSMKVSKKDMRLVIGGVGRVYHVMEGQYPGTLAGGPAGSSTQTVSVTATNLEEQIFFAPEDLVVKP